MFIRLFNGIKVFCALLLLVGALPFLHSKMPLMPLDEVKPGMIGHWKTVVSGTEVETFELKILGVVDNFVGPQQSVIIAEALDESQILLGSVSGMSGSPVFIDGKLIGAYAYGFSWSKEQAIIGITPIDNMLKILEAKRSGPAGETEVKARSGPRSSLRRKGEMPFRLNQREDADWQWRDEAPKHRALKQSFSSLKPLPSPLFVSGISQETLAAFEDKFQARGLKPLQAPMGQSRGDIKATLEPGSAVAGVLMDGDFSMASVGTVTWKDGDTLLAFGHAMDKAGEIAMPMAPAEVITIIQSVESSFKLANVGEAMGTIYQDKLTGVAGKIGEKAPVTPISFNINVEAGPKKTYSGNVFYDRSMTPLVSAISLYESLNSTMEYAAQQTLYVNMRMKIKGHEDLVLKDVMTGAGGGLSLAEGFMSIYDVLMNNPFEEATIESVDFDIDVSDEWRISSLKSIQMLSGEAKAGETYRLAVVMENYLKETTRKIIEVPIPEKLAGQNIRILVGDAMAADAFDKGVFTNTINSLDSLLDYIRDARSSQKIYIKVLSASEGLRVKGQAMFDLPPSVRGLINSKRTGTALSQIKMKTVWQDSIELPGYFIGADSIDVFVK